MIDSTGTIFEGRKIQYIGSHVGRTTEWHTDDRLGMDYGAIGVALFGDFRDDRPTAAQIQSLHTLLKYLCQRYTILPSHVLGHWRADAVQFYRGIHPEGEQTVCPGINLDLIIENWYTKNGTNRPFWR